MLACDYAAKLSAEQVDGNYITNETLAMRF